MKYVFVDDLRFTPERYDLTFRTMEEFLEYIKENPTEPIFLSLDHDMGPDLMNGSEMLRELPYLENNIQEVQFHTSNYDGLKYMHSVFSSARKVGLFPNLKTLNHHKIECIDGVETVNEWYDIRSQR